MKQHLLIILLALLLMLGSVFLPPNMRIPAMTASLLLIIFSAIGQITRNKWAFVGCELL